MPLRGEQVLLRVFLDSADRAPHTPTHDRLVRAARKRRMAGVTVLKGIAGFGHHGLIRRTPLAIVEHVPVVIEIVDVPDAIGGFVEDVLADLLVHGVATLERASVLLYRGSAGAEMTLQLPPPQAPLSTLPRLKVRPPMELQEDGVLLRIFAGESDRFEGKPLHEAILEVARRLGISGATVFRGIQGFGARSAIHKADLLELSTDLPIVIELVDRPSTIQPLLPQLQAMVQDGLITMEHVAILTSHSGPASPHAA